MRYSNSSSPEQYLESVLANWKCFKSANGGICKAIRDLLGKCYELERKERNRSESN